MSALRVIGCDPGFANIGLSIVDILEVGGTDLVATKLITTKPTKGKARNLDDEIRRLAVIEDEFRVFVTQYSPEVLAMEEPSKCLMRRQGQWATNPSLLRTSCLMWGAIHAICRDRGIYCIKVGAQEIKKAICDKKTASKEEIIEAVKGMYPAYSDWPKTKKVEHVADAVGAAITSLTNPVVMVMLKRIRSGV